MNDPIFQTMVLFASGYTPRSDDVGFAAMVIAAAVAKEIYDWWQSIEV